MIIRRQAVVVSTLVVFSTLFFFQNCASEIPAEYLEQSSSGQDAPQPIEPDNSCPSGQHRENSGCVANIQSCPIANGAGEKSWIGTEYGPCLLKSCNSGFASVGLACAAFQPVHRYRYFNHYHSNLANAPRNSNYIYEGAAFYLFTAQHPNTSLMQTCYYGIGNSHIKVVKGGCTAAGLSPGPVLGYISDAQTAGATKPIYQCVTAGQAVHMMTTVLQSECNSSYPINLIGFGI